MNAWRWNRCVPVTLVLFASLTAGAPVVLAQGTSAAAITGVAKDASGGVLPGVTVEASSPALIEGSKTAVTDAQGQYRIVELVPGTYAVKFSLSGFSTMTRQGVVLTANFTATVNMELKVGELSETVQVTAASPLVDVTKVTQQKAITSDLLNTVPTGKNTLSLMAFMPAAAAPTSAQDVGGARGEITVRMSIHGARQSDQRNMMNGMTTNMLENPNGRSFFINPLGAEEVVVETGSGGSAEYQSAGAQINVITRDGSNKFSGILVAAGTNHNLQANNLTSDLISQGLKSVNGARKVYDFNAVIGGPIVKDKLWFSSAHRRNGRVTRVANLFHAADPSAWAFTPNYNAPVDAPEDLRSDNIRLSWAATQRQKITFSYDWQRNNSLDQDSTLDAGTTAVEASSRANAYCNQLGVWQGTWQDALSGHVLLDGGLTAFNNYYAPGFDAPCGGIPDQIQVRDTALGFTYHGTGIRQRAEGDTLVGRFNFTYVTGTHNFKTGINWFSGTRYSSYTERGSTTLPVAYTFSNGAPTSLTEYVSPTVSGSFTLPSLGIFAQDQWSLHRVTLNLGLRYEYLRAYSRAIDEPAGFPQSQPVHFDQVDCLPCWHDLDPRLAVAWDLFGDGKTAVKASVGRYVESLNQAYATTFGPIGAVVTSTTRSWTDSNHDFYPNCDLKNTAANGECGPMANSAFGTTKYNTVPDPNWITGWGKRQYNWQASVGVERELRPGVATQVAYYHRWFGNFTATDNTLVTPANYDPYCITAPVDSRLGSISGSQVCGLYDINPSSFGQVSSVVGLASKFGNPKETYDGVDVNLNAQFGKGGMISGGWNIGNTYVAGSLNGTTYSHLNNCYVVDSPQALYHCQSVNPFQDRFRFNGSYPLPWWDLQVAGVFQNLPAANYQANYTVSTAAIQPSLGRPLAGGTKTVTIDLMPLGGGFLSQRINQLDMRLSKMFRLSGLGRVQANVDVFNLFNSSTVLQANSTYGARWLQPTQILDARLVKFGVQIDF